MSEEKKKASLVSMTRQKSFRNSITEMQEVQKSKPQSGRKTKIICTIGLVSNSVEVLSALMKAGMNVARLNFSHGDHESHAITVQNVREACKQTGLTCAILLDTKGPEIRTGKLKNKNIILQKGQPLQIECNPEDGFLGDETKICLDYANLPKVVSVGGLIKLDDGLLVCRVEKIEGSIVHVTVTNTGELGEKKGVNLPGVKVDLPFMSDKDRADVLFAVKHDLDFIAASFTRRPSDIQEMRQHLGPDGEFLKIICKIENQEGLDKFDEILVEADGIMVARGDLGVEIPIQEVCTAQKSMILKCNRAGKPVITATQMLDSMIVNPRPTRAEAADVANAVFDGTDCVMLSGETAKGKYPVKAVEVMARICKTAELALDYQAYYLSMVYQADRRVDKEEGVAAAAVKLSMDLDSPFMIVLTESGSTGHFIAKYKPAVPVLTLTRSARTARQCLISRGLFPIMTELKEGAAIKECLTKAMQKGWCTATDEIVVASGVHKGQSTGINRIQVFEPGNM